ncbi:MAG: NgoFVII family restriction endonuclease [bacterium]|nr:NgoFVII family restriction endonuclease [bacterium]
MFLNLPHSQRQHYKNLLGLMGSLSRLFSENDTVYLDYRVAENLFCRSFGAKNVSRSDAAVDAVLGQVGVGIKTFTLGNKANYSSEKIAEFNRNRQEFPADTVELINEIASIRNERLNLAKRNYNLEKLVYHCITRKQALIQLFEFDLVPIDIGRLQIQKPKKNIIPFHDDSHQYGFHLAKSTVYMQFDCLNPLLNIPVQILDDPFALLESLLQEHTGSYAITYPTAYLPLYSTSRGDVPERSGLNQWNAGGRARHFDEVYIPIPSEFHQKSPDFFPPRDIHFRLFLPNGDTMIAKVCQDNSKALMSSPNRALGDWLLRSVLNLKEGELLTYDYLLKLGIDSVILQKTGDLDYTIDFTPIGSYEKFINPDETP